MIRFAKIPLRADVAAMQQEVLQLPAAWKAHLNQFDYSGDWHILSLRSPGGSADNIIPELLNVHTAFEDTPLMAQCPAIKRFVSSLNCEITSVRLMNLKSGAFIKPHRDNDLCFENGEARLHIPVFTNEKVSFYSEDDLIPMREGECWYINANIKHSVTNESDSDRIHLVIDCNVNEHIRQLFAQAERNEVEEKPDIAKTQAIIDALRLQNTATSLAIAASLEANMMKEMQAL